MTPEEASVWSGQQHLRWFQIAQRAMGHSKLDALQVRMARSDQGFDAVELHDKLLELARGGKDS